jgi:colanic acid biosynthesis glycosyl transferase WcaI
MTSAAFSLELETRLPAIKALPSPRRILVWSPNYAPELIGIPPLVTDACEWLAARGHDVDVVTGMPNYPHREIAPEYRGAMWGRERRSSVDVRRSWLRVRPNERFLDKALYELSFTACSLPRIARSFRSADVVLCVVPTLSSAAAAASLRALFPRRRRPRLVLWVQDLVVAGAEALDDVGPRRRRILSAAGRVEANVARAADHVVVCSPEFRRHFSSQGVRSDRIQTIYNWVDVDSIQPAPVAERRSLRVLYAGNLGYSQGFETLFDALEDVGGGIELEIVGGGNGVKEVTRLAERNDHVHVRPPVPRDRFPALLAAADVHVVIQRAVSAGANLPSKIGSYLASGRPIVASIGLETAAAELLRASGGALLVPPDSPAELAHAFRTLRDRPELRAELGRKGRRYAVEHLAKVPGLERLERALLG